MHYLLFSFALVLYIRVIFLDATISHQITATMLRNDKGPVNNKRRSKQYTTAVARIRRAPPFRADFPGTVDSRTSGLLHALLWNGDQPRIDTFPQSTWASTAALRQVDSRHVLGSGNVSLAMCSLRIRSLQPGYTFPVSQQLSRRFWGFAFCTGWSGGSTSAGKAREGSTFCF